LNTQQPDLFQTLQKQDLGYVRIVAELWGLDISASDAKSATQQLIHHMDEINIVQENVEALPNPAREGLEELAIHDGMMPWSQFVRRFGEVREMGPGRRDREKPYLNPISPTEMLWYRGLIGRAFFDSPTGPREFIYIPRDIFPLISFSQNDISPSIGREATRKERLVTFPVNDRILDHACTLLAGVRKSLPEDEIESLHDQWDESYTFLSHYTLTPQILKALLSAAGLLDKDGQPQSEPVRSFLEASRGEALSKLVSAYLHSSDFNELYLIPELQPEGAWVNDPLQTREEIFRFLSWVPEGTWWSLSNFIADVREKHPDFQRPTGDYDSWFIRDKTTGEYLRGFEHWNRVEGALIRFTITGLLHWLGIVDLAAPSKDIFPEAFRLSKWSQALFKGNIPEGLPEENDSILVASNAQLRVPRLAPRVARYQIARFCQWDGENEKSFRYHLTPESLNNAKRQSLQISHLLALLNRYASAVPPILVKALERWDERGTEARIEQAFVLRLSSPDILKQLRASRAARFLGAPLGPTAIIVKPGAREKIIAALAEMGYIGEMDV
jgi:hypothetical protein